MSLNEADGRAVLIAGPTASGKSRLALELAAATGGVVINTDSMQVYDGLQILTARPSPADLTVAPHRLYGHVAPSADYSVGEWSREVAILLAELRAAGRLPIFCGGTGLYFKALMGGLDEMPAIPDAIRAHWRARMAAEGPVFLHAELARADPQAAARIRPGDPQRITRALEIVDATGAPLSALQRGTAKALIDASAAQKIVLTPPRDVLRARIASRFSAMLGAGALVEAERFAARPDAMASLAGKAIGVLELTEHLKGLISLGEAERRAVARSRQYAKRQVTWFRHQLGPDWIGVSERNAIDIEKLKACIKGG